ncbi:MAG TPA: hypothetical protein VHI54_02840 [Actinomycetota bacterium]|nr:hypothetical protein [Actinomycetota bacterium]
MEVTGAVARRRRSLVAVSFTLFLSTAGVLGFFGPADAAPTNQLLPPKPQPSLCPRGTTLITKGLYKGLCYADGVIIDPITRKIIYSSPPELPVNPPTLPSTELPSGTQPNPAPGTGTGTSPPTTGRPSSGGRPHLISSSITSAHSYGTPYGVFFGNFGGGKTFFSPSGLSRYETYRKVYYLSAFGRPLSSDVSTAVIDATRVAPVSTRVPQAPDEVWLLLPFGLVLMTMVTYLVLEPDADRRLA